MKYLQLTFTGILALFLLFGTGCKKDKLEINLPDTPITGTGWNSGSNQTMSFAGRIADVNNVPLEGVLVTVQGQTTYTDAFGVYRLFDVEANDQRAYLTFYKAGYFLGSKAIRPTPNSMNLVDSKLLERTLVGTIGNTTGGSLTTSDGVELIFDPGDVAYPNGTTFSGSVKVYATYLDPTDEMIVETMPGDLQALNASNELVFLKTYGMVIVELEDNSGQELNVAAGTTVGINFPIQALQLASAPATIPLWYFDEEEGIWKEEGQASKVAGQYKAEVAHFTPWNCDMPTIIMDPSINFKVKLLNTAGEPLIDYRIRFSDGDGMLFFYRTNSDGIIDNVVPQGFNLNLNYFNSCDPLTSWYSEDIVTDTDIDLGTRVIDDPNLKYIDATITTTCESGPDLYFIEYWNNIGYGGEYRYLSPGYFTQEIGSCTSSSNTHFKIKNVNTGKELYWILNPAVISLYDINLCSISGSEPDEFIQTNFDGTNYSINGASDISMNMGYVTPMQDSVLLWSEDLIGNSITLVVDGFTGIGSYTTGKLRSFNGTNYSGNINFNCTLFGAIGEYTEGNYSGTVLDAASNPHTVSGSFRVVRNF